MPFPRKLLTEGEEVVIDARPHWIAILGSAFVTLLLVAGVIASLVLIHGKHNGIIKLVIAGVALILFIIYPLRRFIAWATSHFVVTNQRLIHRSGLIAKNSMEVPLNRINDVRFHQGVFERMIGAGDLIVESAGTQGQEVFQDVRHPDMVQKTIYERAQAYQNIGPGAAVPAAAPAPAAPPSVTEELGRLADLRDRGVITAEEFEAQKAKLLGES